MARQPNPPGRKRKRKNARQRKPKPGFPVQLVNAPNGKPVTTGGVTIVRVGDMVGVIPTKGEKHGDQG